MSCYFASIDTLGSQIISIATSRLFTEGLIHYLFLILFILVIWSLKNRFICSYRSDFVICYFIVYFILWVNNSQVILTQPIVSNILCVSMSNEFINKKRLFCQPYTIQEIYSYHTGNIGSNLLSGSVTIPPVRPSSHPVVRSSVVLLLFLFI